MNAAFDGDSTRWERAVEAVTWIVEADNGYLQGNVMLALLRFGHDPDVDQPGTTIAGDASGLVDGQKLDVSWYDELAPNKEHFHCNGQAVMSTPTATPPQTCDAGTKFYNVLIMDGTYDSDDAAVEASLTQLFADGVRTYVVGLGELAEAP